MGLIDLTKIEPHKVSRDLSGYITFIYGAPKTGKTTLAVQMPDALLLAFEKGYNALPGVKAVDITSWAEMLMVYRQLKSEDVKAMYKTIIVDTVDIAAEMCQKYVCDQLDVENLGDAGYGKGWSAFSSQFKEVFRGLTQLGYAVFFIGHEKLGTKTDSAGNEYNYIGPAISGSAAKQCIEGMADIYGYAHQVRTSDMSVLTLRADDDSITCGGRFHYIKKEIPFTYDDLVAAVREAIDQEAAEHDGKYVTDEKEKEVQKIEYDFDAMKEEFATMAGELMNKDPKVGPRITAIVDKHLGKGKKVQNLSPSQAELLALIIMDMKEEFKL